MTTIDIPINPNNEITALQMDRRIKAIAKLVLGTEQHAALEAEWAKRKKRQVVISETHKMFHRWLQGIDGPCIGSFCRSLLRE